jgi:hypothetical protein
MSFPQSNRQVETGQIILTIARRLGMVIALALAFFLSATITIYLLFRSGSTRVPNVIGKSEAEAQKMAEKAGLRVKIQRRSDPAVPANTVIETRPAPNSSIKRDSSLTIVVSSGPPQTSVRSNQRFFAATLYDRSLRTYRFAEFTCTNFLPQHQLAADRAAQNT